MCVVHHRITSGGIDSNSNKVSNDDVTSSSNSAGDGCQFLWACTGTGTASIYNLDDKSTLKQVLPGLASSHSAAGILPRQQDALHCQWPHPKCC
jgi:hypothetical protein